MQEMLCEDCLRMHAFIPLEENQDLHWDNKIGEKTLILVTALSPSVPTRERFKARKKKTLMVSLPCVLFKETKSDQYLSLYLALKIINHHLRGKSILMASISKS